MKRTILNIDAPSHWASYLVNGDMSGTEPHELKECDEWLYREGLSLGECTGILDDSAGEGDAHFFGRFEFPLQGTLQCDMYTYTFLLSGESK